MKPNHKQISKFLSLILRHDPGKIGLALDDQGWADVQTLLTKLQKQFSDLDLNLLQEIVSSNDKQRFAFDENHTKIRASQGHSVTIDLNYSPKQPPQLLYHGTVAKFIEAIKEKGLLKMSRHHVHLSEELDTALTVGARRGKPIILTVRAGEMYSDGIPFFQSDNQVWLTDHVPAKYLEFKEVKE